MTFGIQKSLFQELLVIFGKLPEINQIRIFGSRAIGVFKKNSDVDLAFFGENLTITQLGQIRDEIEDLPTLLTFDLIIFHQIKNPELVEHIEQVGKIIYEK